MSSEDISADILGMQKKGSIDIEQVSRGPCILRDILSKACLILNKPAIRESIFLSFTALPHPKGILLLLSRYEL